MVDYSAGGGVSKKGILNTDIFNSYIWDKDIGEKPLDISPKPLTKPIPLNQYIKENSGIKVIGEGSGETIKVIIIGLVALVVINIFKR